MKEKGFILNSGGLLEQPLSYTEARRSYKKIQSKFNLDGYSAHDFRDTCATEWREQGIPLDIIARMLGHSTVQVTERRYVKYREDLYKQVKDIWNEGSVAEKDEEM